MAVTQCILITDLHSGPDRLPGAVILKMSHGYSIKHDGNDPLVRLAEHVVGTVISEAVQPGKWLVDNVPIRAYQLYMHFQAVA